MEKLKRVGDTSSNSPQQAQSLNTKNGTSLFPLEVFQPDPNFNSNKIFNSLKKFEKDSKPFKDAVEAFNKAVMETGNTPTNITIPKEPDIFDYVTHEELTYVHEVYTSVFKSATPFLNPTSEEIEETLAIYRDDKVVMMYRFPWFGILLEYVSPNVIGHFSEIPLAAIDIDTIMLKANSTERITKQMYDLYADSRKDPLINKALEIYIEHINNTLGYTSLEPSARIALLMHEILHLVFDHVKPHVGYDHSMLNAAMDAIINRIIYRDVKNCSYPGINESIVDINKIPGGVKYVDDDTFTMGSFKDSDLITVKLNNWVDMDYVSIYKALYERKQKCQSGGNSGNNTSENSSPGVSPCGNQTHNMDGDCIGEELSPPEKVELTHRVESATSSAKSTERGFYPSEVEALIDELGQSKVHWTSILRNLVNSLITQDDYSFYPSSRRQHIAYMPILRSIKPSDIWTFIDTSGSMDIESIKQGLTEFAQIKSMLGAGVYVGDCDAEVHNVTYLAPHESFDLDNIPINGRGGTSFVPAFELIEKLREENKIAKPSVVVFFTDTWGEFPTQQPDYPVIWVSDTPGGSVPWGYYITINGDDVETTKVS